MMFGFSTLLDLLSWIVAVTLGVKVLATLILLNFDKSVWDQPGWGAILWWSTKITPIIAVPCVIFIAWLQGMNDQIWIFVGLMVFVVVAVPWKIRQRRARIADRATVELRSDKPNPSVRSASRSAATSAFFHPNEADNRQAD